MSLEVRDLRFGYGTPLLQGVDLEVAPGEAGFLLGPSGSGKTTALRCIAGLEPTYGGSVRLDGATLDEVPTHKRGIGMLFQEPALFPHLSAWQNVAFGLRYTGLPRDRYRAEASLWLDRVDLTARHDAAVDELSGGQRQRVALARTLAARPRAVLLDEPLSSLDEPLRVRLGQGVKTLLKQQGVASLWVTHDRHEAARLGDRVWRLEAGRAVPVSLEKPF